MNQKQLAQAAGASQSYISEIETGSVTNPTIAAIGKLAEALGVKPLALLQGPPVPVSEGLHRRRRRRRVVARAS